MIHITRADVEWLGKLLRMTEYVYAEYPELFTEEEVEVLQITRQLIRSIS